MQTIEQLQNEMNFIIHTLESLRKKADAAFKLSLDMHDKETEAANEKAAEYDHEDDAIDAGVYDITNKIETLSTKFEGIESDIKTILNYAKY